MLSADQGKSTLSERLKVHPVCLGRFKALVQLFDTATVNKQDQPAFQRWLEMAV